MRIETPEAAHAYVEAWFSEGLTLRQISERCRYEINRINDELRRMKPCRDRYTVGIMADMSAAIDVLEETLEATKKERAA